MTIPTVKEPYGWAVERPGDGTFPRLYRTKQDADAMAAFINVNPLASVHPLYTSSALSTRQPCPGCDGYECDDGCAYPVPARGEGSK